MKAFGEYVEQARWDAITLFDTTLFGVGYYPDYFLKSLDKYRPVIDHFRRLVAEAPDSITLFRAIQSDRTKSRLQLLRIFRRYVCPIAAHEVISKKNNTERSVGLFGPHFRDIETVKKNIAKEDFDICISVLLYESKDRSKLGYILEEKFCEWFRSKFSPTYKLIGQCGPGSDIEFSSLFPDYPHQCPCDFVIRNDERPLVVGFVRYDTGRGGSQELDRPKANLQHAKHISEYLDSKNLPLKILLLNDGPGLLAGKMWNTYRDIEEENPRVMVATLRMLDQRLTEEWMLSRQKTT